MRRPRPRLAGPVAKVKWKAPGGLHSPSRHIGLHAGPIVTTMTSIAVTTSGAADESLWSCHSRIDTVGGGKAGVRTRLFPKCRCPMTGASASPATAGVVSPGASANPLQWSGAFGSARPCAPRHPPFEKGLPILRHSPMNIGQQSSVSSGSWQVRANCLARQWPARPAAQIAVAATKTDALQPILGVTRGLEPQGGLPAAAAECPSGRLSHGKTAVDSWSERSSGTRAIGIALLSLGA